MSTFRASPSWLEPYQKYITNPATAGLPVTSQSVSYSSRTAGVTIFFMPQVCSGNVEAATTRCLIERILSPPLLELLRVLNRKSSEADRSFSERRHCWL